jgi:HAD superfamily hydrolase (TIGR01509 family)
LVFTWLLGRSPQAVERRSVGRRIPPADSFARQVGQDIVNLTIFDCDGVLVESESILLAAELEFLSKAGLTIERDDYMRRFMGMPPEEWERQVGEALAEQGKGPVGPHFFSDLYELTAQKLRTDLVEVTGARASIEQLASSLCVASSSAAEEIRWKLSHTGLIDLFDPHLFSTQLVKNGKPAPDLFLLAADRMGVAASTCVVVEDSSNGVVAAKRAGMKVIGFSAGSHCPARHGETLLADGADVIVRTYSRLPEVIGNL